MWKPHILTLVNTICSTKWRCVSLRKYIRWGDNFRLSR